MKKNNEIKQLKNELRKYKALSYHDALTKLYNRRKLELDLERFLYEHSRYKIRFSIIMIDVDNFKSLNDSRGHNFGDKILRDIAKSLKILTRKTDKTYRYGGDEFMVILPHTTLKTTKEVAIRIEEHSIVPITTSITKISKNRKEMIELLDKKLYEKKRSK